MKTVFFFVIVVGTMFASFIDCFAAVPIGKTIPELKLKDERVLKNVFVVGHTTSSIVARWDGGRGTIPFSLLPDELWRSDAPSAETRAIRGKIQIKSATGPLSIPDEMIYAYPRNQLVEVRRRLREHLPARRSESAYSRQLSLGEAWMAALRNVNSVASTKSDSEGRFEIHILPPMSDVFLFALTTQKIGEGADLHVWVVTPSGDTQDLTTANAEPW